jgi:anti-sigma factor RsiW
MTCREFIEFLMQYLDGELPRDRRAVFDAHLAECPWCVAYMHNYEQTITLGQAAFEPTDDPVPSEVPVELVKAILAARDRV